MAHLVYIGIDNGTTGTIGWVGEGVHPTIIETPVRVEQSYTKSSKNTTRIDHERITALFKEIIGEHDPSEVLVVMERPFTGSFIKGKNNAVKGKNDTGGRGGFVANISAARAFEVTLVLVEQAKLPHEIVDSKQWQKVMLPKGVTGSDARKAASKDIGLRLFPDQEEVINKHKDADGLLIATWASRENL